MPRIDLEWEASCIERARRGEREAFAELYRAFAPEIFARVLIPLLGDRAAAEDALGDTFRTALEKMGSFEKQGVSIFHWLAAIARNKALDMHRARQRTARTLCGFENLLEHFRRRVPTAEDELQADEERAALRRAVGGVLDRLNPRYREAIELRFVQDLGRTECATRLGLQLGTFDVLLLRALRAFRREWEEKE